MLTACDSVNTKHPEQSSVLGELWPLGWAVERGKCDDIVGNRFLGSPKKSESSTIRQRSGLCNPVNVIKHTGLYNFNRQIICILNIIWLVFFNHLFIISQYP